MGIVDIAKKYIGYHEKETDELEYLFDNTANSGNKDWNKFAWYMDNTIEGTFFNTTKFHENYNWCSIFVHYCIWEACHFNNQLAYSKMHEPTDPSANTGAVVSYVKQFFENAGKYHAKDSGYQPKVGDIILFYELFQWQHIGIISEVTETTITYVHGNSNYPSYTINVDGLTEAEIRNSVRENRVPISWSVIGGYCEMGESANAHIERFNRYGAKIRR